jgi:membrane-associated phospholipid phosphatase
VNGPDTPSSAAAATLPRNILRNFERWSLVLSAPERLHISPRYPIAVAVSAVLLAATVVSMFLFDAAATEWALGLPQWFRDVFERITNFGLSGWFLFPFGFILLCLAGLISPALSRMSRGVLAALAARIGFLFLAIAVPGLFVAIVKRLIGRARPTVGGHDDPFAFMPFIWRPEYASLPSGHATTAVAAAIAIGAIWPRTRVIMWLYASTIMFSRVVVLAHHPSDVVAGALVGAAGAILVRRWFAARCLVFSPLTLQPCYSPSLRRIGAALREAVSGLQPSR